MRWCTMSICSPVNIQIIIFLHLVFQLEFYPCFLVCEEESLGFLEGLNLDAKTSIVDVRKYHSKALERLQCFPERISTVILEFEHPSDLDFFLDDIYTLANHTRKDAALLDTIILIGSWSTFSDSNGIFSKLGSSLQNISHRSQGVINITRIGVKVPYPFCSDVLNHKYDPEEFLSVVEAFKKVVFPDISQRRQISWGFVLGNLSSLDDGCNFPRSRRRPFKLRLLSYADFIIVLARPPPFTFGYGIFSESLKSSLENILNTLKFLMKDKEILLLVDMNHKNLAEFQNGHQLSTYNYILAKFTFKLATESNLPLAYPVLQSFSSENDINYGQPSVERVLKFNRELMLAALSYKRFHTLITMIIADFPTILIETEFATFDRAIAGDMNQIRNITIELEESSNYNICIEEETEDSENTQKSCSALELFVFRLAKFNKERLERNQSTINLIVKYIYPVGGIMEFQKDFQKLERIDSKYSGVICGMIISLKFGLCHPNYRSTWLPYLLEEVKEISLQIEGNPNITLLSVDCSRHFGVKDLVPPKLTEGGYQLVQKLQENQTSISYFQQGVELLDMNEMSSFLYDLSEIKNKNKIDQLWLQIYARSDKGGFDCATFNEFNELVLNWASTFRAKLVLEDAFDHYKEGTRGWFGTYSSAKILNGGGQTASDFFVKAEEACVVVALGVFHDRIPFNSSIAGISLNLLSNSTFGNASLPELGILIQLINLKFKTLEITCDDGELQKIVQIGEILGKVQSREKSFHKSKIYLNIPMETREGWSNFEEMKIIKKISRKIGPEIIGIHFSGNANECVNIKNIKMQISKEISVGCELKFKEVVSNYWEITEESVKHLDYIVLDVNIYEFIETLGYSVGPNMFLTHTFKFDEMVVREDFAIFYHIFESIKKFRYLITKLDPDLEVMLRFRWPTFESQPLSTTSEKGSPELGNMLRVWKFVNEFSTAFHFRYFIYQAVDNEPGQPGHLEENGWWRLNNYSNLSDISIYLERESEYLGLETPKPLNIFILNPAETGEPQTTSTILFPVLGFVVVSSLFMIAVIVILSFRLRRRNEILSREEVQLFLYGLDKGSSGGLSEEEKLVFGNPYNGDLEIKRDDFIPEASTIIGSGNFGAVYKADIPRLGGRVAVKIPHSSRMVGDNSSISANFKMLLSEIKIMSCVREHENVLQILGAYTKEIRRGVVYIVSEFCELGSLHGYLRTLAKRLGGGDEQTPDLYEMYKFSYEIANGMEYIGSKSIMHGDLSTRNVLLSAEKICKISDFGLSRKLESYGKYMKKGEDPLPWRWLAIECLKNMEFTVQSDVWSYGVTIWEIFSLGDTPYPELSWNDDFLSKLIDGLRLSSPKLANEEVYALLLQCWDWTPTSRPKFSEVILRIQNWKNVEYTQLVD